MLHISTKVLLSSSGLLKQLISLLPKNRKKSASCEDIASVATVLPPLDVKTDKLKDE